MQLGAELEQYLTTCQSIPDTFIRPTSIHYYHQNWTHSYYKPVLQERSKQERKRYCKLVIIQITKAHATGGGVGTYLTTCQSILATFITPHQQYPLLSSKLDPYKPVLQKINKL
jgi:hypothetical protein